MRKAVLVIHGIGEQKPMETLRKFVKSVLNPGEMYYSAPEKMSDNIEMRRLKGTNQRKVDFYEYYWAHLMEGTKLSHVFSWLWNLLKRRRSDVPDSLFSVWILCR